MRQAQETLRVKTAGKGFTDVTAKARRFLAANPCNTGLMTMFCRHTSASLLIQENADPSVRRDLQAYFERIAPEAAAYEHDTEGPDDMPAHIRTALTQTHLAIPIISGELAPRHLAGHLSLRAPPCAPYARTGAASHRRMRCRARRS